MNHEKEWTTMIFMAGDNNLSIDMAYSLEKLRMEAGPAMHDGSNLFVYYKNNTGETPPVYCDFTDPENPVFIFENEVSSLQDGRANRSNADSLVEFADWCVNKAEYLCDGKPFKGRKARNYALVLAGHSIGFLSFGLFADDSSEKKMSIPQLHTSLKKVNDEIIGRKLSILGFDSCVMSMAEVAFEFSDVAETMIASEGGVPNAGWTYPGMLAQLTECRSKTDLQNIVQNCVVSYIEQQANYSIGGVSADMAAWDLSELDALERTFAKLSDTLIKSIADEGSQPHDQMRRILLQARWNSQTYMLDQNVDLGDFCTLLASEIELFGNVLDEKRDHLLVETHKSCTGVLDGIGKCILLSGFSGTEYQHSTGISIFFPMSLSAYAAAQKDYEDLKFVSNSCGGKPWNRFLVNYLSEVTLRPPRQVDPTPLPIHSPVEVQAYGNNNVSSFTLLDNSIQFPCESHQTRCNSMDTSRRLLMNTAKRMPVNPTTRMPVNPTTRMPVNPTTRMPFNPIARMPVNPTTRMPVNPIARMPFNPITRMPFNPTTRMPFNPIARMPVNPIAGMPVNSLSRLGGASKALNELSKLKNHSSNALAVGYTCFRNL